MDIAEDGAMDIAEDGVVERLRSLNVERWISLTIERWRSLKRERWGSLERWRSLSREWQRFFRRSYGCGRKSLPRATSREPRQLVDGAPAVCQRFAGTKDADPPLVCLPEAGTQLV